MSASIVRWGWLSVVVLEPMLLLLVCVVTLVSILAQYESSVQNDSSDSDEPQLNMLSSANRSTKIRATFVDQLREHKRASAVTDAIAGVLLL